MLQTNLTHVESGEEFQKLIGENEKVMLCCGRMGPMCLPVYDIMEGLASEYSHVQFRDMDFDGPASHIIRRLPEVREFMGLPFTLYFEKGQVVKATSSIQNRDQIVSILNETFAKAA